MAVRCVVFLVLCWSPAVTGIDGSSVLAAAVVREHSFGKTGVAKVGASEGECVSKGEDWKCDGQSKGEKPVKNGDKCKVECLTEGYKPATKKILCTDGALEETPVCSRDGASEGDCVSKGIDWKCDGQSNGEKPVKNGDKCKVECLTDGFKPATKKILCKDGAFEEAPVCSGDSVAIKPGLAMMVLITSLFIQSSQ